MSNNKSQENLSSFDKINGYYTTDLQVDLFSHLSLYTASYIRKKIADLHVPLGSLQDEVIYLSIGENCGPAMRMREAGLNLLGDNFFDFLVCPTESFIKIVDANFADILSIANLSISSWEGHDSVLDELYGILYHHCFHLNPVEREKSRYINGIRRRTIDESDIPLFLAQVRAQFEYLAIKFRVILRSPVKKILVSRRIEGDPFSGQMMHGIESSLSRFGAQNYRVVYVYSKRAADGSDTEGARQHYIPQNQERWGDTSDWSALGKSTG